jgi:hypothetical protein
MIMMLISGPAGPMINIFSLTTLMARVRLHSLYNFAAAHITSSYSSSTVLGVFVSTEMYFNKSIQRNHVSVLLLWLNSLPRKRVCRAVT